MNILFRTLFSALTSIAIVQCSSAVMAQNFVSGLIGDDSQDTCRFARRAGTGLPCLTFAYALSKAQDGDGIACVDPAVFGPINITKAITIDCKRGGGTGNAQYISIDAPGKTVRLRNLSVTGGGVGLVGILIYNAAVVELDNVFISGSNIGIDDRRTGPGKLSIRNSQIAGGLYQGNPAPGIVIEPFGGSIINVVLDHVIMRENSYGLAVAKGGRVMAINSTFSQNSVAGIESDTGGIIEIHNALISNNTTGVVANTGSFISLSNASLESNNTGISGATQSFGTNRFIRNAITDGTPPTPFGAMSVENGSR